MKQKTRKPLDLKKVHLRGIEFYRCDKSLLRYRGGIHLEVYDETIEDARYNPIGTISAYVMTPSDGDLDMVADAISQDVYNAAVFVEKFSESETSDFFTRALYVSEMQIDSAHRGHDLGLSALRSVIVTAGYGCDVVVVMPAAIRSALGEALSDKQADQASKKLRAHYARLGFVKCKDDPSYMWLDLRLKATHELLACDDEDMECDDD